MPNTFGLTLSTAATAEPVTLQEAKDHLRNPPSADDGAITDLITAAREAGERFTGRQWVTATWILRLDYFPAEIILPNPPLQSVSSIQYVDTAGATQTVSSADYQVDATTVPGRIAPVSGATWPTTKSGTYNTVVVTFLAGWGAASAVPEEVKTWVKQMVAHAYENRTPIELALKEEPTLWGALWGYKNWSM